MIVARILVTVPVVTATVFEPIAAVGETEAKTVPTLELEIHTL